jgi:hypothetical protein
VAGPAYPCLWCRQPIVFVTGQGWLHPEGGLYMRRCACGWRGAPALAIDLCPRCNAAKPVDDHLATPDRTEPPQLQAMFRGAGPTSPAPPAVAAAPAADDFVDDPTRSWRDIDPASGRDRTVVVAMPLRAEFEADAHLGPLDVRVRVVAIRKDGAPHLLSVSTDRGDILHALTEAAAGALRDQAAMALDLEERSIAALEEAQHVGTL